MHASRLKAASSLVPGVLRKYFPSYQMTHVLVYSRKGRL